MDSKIYKTTDTINPKIIIGLAIILGFFLHFLGFDLDGEAYKDLFVALATIFATLVAFIGMLLIFRLESLENRKLSAFQDLRNVVRSIGSYVKNKNLGGSYQSFVRFDYEAFTANDLLLKNVDDIVSRYKRDNEFRDIMNEDQTLQGNLSVDLNVASENVHTTDRLLEKAKIQLNDLFLNMFAIIVISIVFLTFRNINISSTFFQWLVDFFWESWGRSVLLIVVLGFSIVTLIKAYTAIKSFSED